MEKRRLLFISYHFPPTGGSSVQRSLKFVKYLPAFGWEPVILTVSNPAFKQTDPTLLQELPQNICVHKIRRFPVLPFAERYRVKDGHKYDTNGKPVFVRSTSQFLKPAVFIINKSFDLLKYIANNFVYVPDWHIGWLPGAVIKGVALIKKNDVKIIYATGEPWTSFLVAVLISKLTKIPYVLDFRDPWTLNPLSGSPGKIHRWACDRLEELCIRYADKVIFTCNRSMKAYQEKYKNGLPDKFITITHGYEEEDFERVTRNRTNSGIFIISYVGTLYPHHYEALDTFFMAICNILKKSPQMGKNLRINFIGITNIDLDLCLQKYEIRDIVRLVGYVGFQDSIQYMVNSTMLLLFGDKYSLQVSGKIYEYLAARRPILILTSMKSDAALLVRENNAGIHVELNDLAGTEKAILNFYNSQYRWRNLYSLNIKNYTRKKLAGRLAGEFDAIVACE